MELTPERLKNILESILFVARKPLSVEEISRALQLPQESLFSALEELTQTYTPGGINIVKVVGGYLMGTNPENADYVEKILRVKVSSTLSPQALETLSIIAYKQPITRAEIERIRGVISDGVIETLLAKKLIEEKGRSEAPGRPFLYGTTAEFMRHFGLQDLSALPPLPSTDTEQEALFKTALHEETPGA